MNLTFFHAIFKVNFRLRNFRIIQITFNNENRRLLVRQYIISTAKFMFLTEYKYEAVKHINVVVTKHLSNDPSIIDSAFGPICSANGVSPMLSL